MKRSKVFFSFLFALVFVFQLGAMAFAAPDNGFEFKAEASLAYQLTAELAKVDEQGGAVGDETEFVVIGEDNKAAVGGGFSVKVGDADLETGLSLKEALSKQISVTVPAGYYVSALALRAQSDAGTAPVDLLSRAVADPCSANITLKAGALAVTDETGKVYLDSRAVTGDPGADAFVLDIVLSKIAADAEITVTADGVALTAGGGPAVFTAPPAPEFKAALQSFSGWKLVYANHSSVLVNENTEFSPYASCSLESVFTPVVHSINVIVSADKTELNENEIPALSYTIDEGYTATVEYTVYDADKAAVDASALTAGSYTVKASVSDVTTDDGTLLPADNCRLIVNDVVLTVKAADSGSTEAPSDTPNDEPEPAGAPADEPDPAGDPDPANEPEPGNTVTGGNTVVDGGSDQPPAEPITLTITVKEPIFDAQTNSYKPDGDGYTITGLADGDTVSVIKFEADEERSTYTVSELEIVDKDGNEVAFKVDGVALYAPEAPKYNVVVNDAAITPRSTAVTVAVSDITVTYDGKEHAPTDADYTVTGLDTGLKLRPVFNSETNACDKAVELKSWEIVKTDSSNAVVASSENPNGYTVDVSGKIIINKKDATISIKDDIVFRTNGTTPFNLSSGNISATGLVTDHKYAVTSHFEKDSKKVENPSAAGEYAIVIDKCEIYDKSQINGNTVTGSPLTDNYNLTLKNGKVTIEVNEKAIPLTITAKSGSFVYDGSAHTVEGWESVDGLKDGDKLVSVKYKSSSTQTIPGETNAEIESVVIQTSDGKAVPADKYTFNLNPGKITVTKPKLTLTAVSDEKVYDGKALNNNNVKASQDLSKTSFKLSVGLSVTDKAGNSVRNGPVNVGTYTKKVSTVKITLNGVDVTEYFDVTCIDGTLTIKSGTNGSTSAGVKTGDNSKLGLWIGILAVCAVIIVVIVIILLKKRNPVDDTDPADLPDEPVDESAEKDFEIDISIFDEKDDK